MTSSLILAILSISLLLLGSCREKREQGLAKKLTLTGINGIANYHISNGEVVTVAKDEYLRPAEYFIQINKDTVILGNEFIARLFVPKPKFKINIEEPRIDTIGGAAIKPDSANKRFVFPTERLGLFSFKGHLEYDTVVVPFEYKFIVIPQK